MLKKGVTKTQFVAVYCVLALIQFYAAYTNQLFGDEAFYWFEGQYLDWSYSELPGWTQWTTAFSEWLFPHHEFTVRLPGLCAALLIPWVAVLIAHKLTDSPEAPWQAGLLMLSLPLLAMAGTLAIPDIWLVFFTLLAVYTLVMCHQTQRKKWFMWLGIALALGINVHVRFWVVVLLGCILTMGHLRHHKQFIKRLLTISFPIMLIGFMPILLFNVQHDFPLFNFQFNERHPWHFQSTHFLFFLIQILITTPLLFILCLKTSLNAKMSKSIPAILIQLAVLHWLVYAILGFFSDNLRFNVHWTLISYVLLLLASVVTPSSSKVWIKWSIITGTALSIIWLSTLSYWMSSDLKVSKFNAQITENSRGWKEMAQQTEQLINQLRPDQLITDNFMTMAELKFYLPTQNIIKSMSHPLNIKHGRETQLELMSLIQNPSKQNNLLIVEQTALKLNEQIDFYLEACRTLNGIKQVGVLNQHEGLKTFHYFMTGHGLCKPPLIAYTQKHDQLLTGWVLSHHSQIREIQIMTNENQLPEYQTITDLGSNQLFAQLDPTEFQIIEFTFENYNDLNDSGIIFTVAGETELILKH